MERFVILLALAGLSYLLLYTEGLVKTSRARFAMLGVLLAAFGVRFILFGIAPNDTAAAVEDAIVWYRDAGGFWGIRSSALPYSIPVQYFLALFSLAPGGGLTLFKYICVFAEVTMAWAAQRCVQCVTVRAQPRLFAFLIVLLLPSGIFQGVCSAAGDSLWWVFIALAASCAMRGEWRWCAGMLALAVAFHPAALWIVPVFWVFTAVRRNTWFSLLHLVGWYIAVLVPALLLGRPGSECLPGARNAHGAAAFRRSAGYLLALAAFVHRADRHCALHRFRAAARMAHEPEKSRLRPAAAADGALSCLALRRGVPAVDVCRQSLRRGGAPCRALLPGAESHSRSGVRELRFGACAFEGCLRQRRLSPARLGKPRAPRRHGRSSAVSGFEEKAGKANGLSGFV